MAAGHGHCMELQDYVVDWCHGDGCVYTTLRLVQTWWLSWCPAAWQPHVHHAAAAQRGEAKGSCQAAHKGAPLRLIAVPALFDDQRGRNRQPSALGLFAMARRVAALGLLLAWTLCCSATSAPLQPDASALAAGGSQVGGAAAAAAAAVAAPGAGSTPELRS